MNLFKTLVIAATIAIVQTTVFAQETPAGRNAAATFWKAIEGNRPVQAKSSLDSLKQREPNFDVSKMEKALAELTGKREAERTASRNETRAKLAAAQILEKLFGFTLRGSSLNDAGDIDAAIAENSALTGQVLAMDRASIKRDLDTTLARLKGAIPSNDRKVADLSKGIDESTDAEHSRRLYNQLVLRRSLWENASKVFPDEASIRASYESVSASIKGLGTPDQMAARADKNHNAMVDAERLPRAAVSDPKLENWFKSVFIDTAQLRGRNYTFLKVLITGTDYQVRRNELTGIILGRSRGAAIAFKDADGKCKYGRFTIEQDYDGSKFTGETMSMNVDLKEIRCVNVK
jgi:hypothetical protein